MPTDDERRAVARRLRRSRSEWSGMGWRLWLGPKFCAVVLSDGNRDELEDAAHRLADLIDPPTQCPHYHSDRHYCSVHEDVQPIDRDALLALEDEMFEDANGLAFISQLEKNEELQDLQSTMAKALMDYARRIREVLGVPDERTTDATTC